MQHALRSVNRVSCLLAGPAQPSAACAAQPAAQAYEVEVSEGVRKLARCVDADTAH